MTVSCKILKDNQNLGKHAVHMVFTKINSSFEVRYTQKLVWMEHGKQTSPHRKMLYNNKNGCKASFFELSFLRKFQKAVSNWSQVNQYYTTRIISKINNQNNKNRSILSTSKYPKLTISFNLDKFPEKVTTATFFMRPIIFIVQKHENKDWVNKVNVFPSPLLLVQ